MKLMPLSRPARRLAVILAIAIACAGAGYTYRYGVRDHVLIRNFGVVESGKLYRSGRLTPSTTEQLVRTNHIKTIVDLGAYKNDPVEQRVAQQTADALGVKRIQFALEGDGTGDPQMYVDALKVMADPANQPVLVHCAAGAQRTSVCVMLYRKIFQNVPFETSIEEAKAHKHDPKDNPALKKYWDENAEMIAQKVRGSMDSAPAPRVGER
jgi:protein tyrosine/serine phosphatase